MAKKSQADVLFERIGDSVTERGPAWEIVRLLWRTRRLRRPACLEWWA